MSVDLNKIQKKLFRELDRDRYNHTLGVMYTSAALAMRYGADMDKALVAGLLHDCAKCIPNDKKIRICTQNGIDISKSEEANPFLLHAKLGAFLAESKYDIHDPEILDAISFHTTGRPNMTLLEKIVYIADYIEPGRNKAKNLDEVRELAFVDLDRTLFVILRDTLIYLKGNLDVLDPTTKLAYDYYLDLHSRRQSEYEPDLEEDE